VPTTLFRYDVRILLCEQCGAPLDAAQEGGHIACRYCRAQNQIGRRNTTMVGAATAGRPRMPEPERLMRLRAQDGRPMAPPPGVEHLFGPSGTIEPWKMQEALTVWQQTRSEVRATGSPAAAERLHFLTVVLAAMVGMQGDAHRQRALLESALDVAALPRHRQALFRALARCAVRDGDIQAAEAWLAACDPVSDELETDTDFRLGRAYIDTVRGNFMGVLAALGSGPNDVPIHDSADGVCAILRANALERTGQLQAAVASLMHFKQKAGDRMAMQKVMEAHRQWNLCPQSYAIASQQHTSAAASQAASAASGNIHLVFMPVGALLMSVTAVCIVLMFAGVVPLAAAPGIVFGAGLTGTIFFFVGRAMKKAADRAKHLRLHGLSGTGEVQGITTTGTRINNVPMVEVHLLVRLQGMPPFAASTKVLQTAIPGVAPGVSVPIRADPQNPSDVMIETA
jgi:DNA-directed RNA polymerase subunit RPC12/RpoP